jgi:hypothetical protein
VKASGKVSKEDYDQVLEPMLNEARKEGRRVRFLYELGAEFEGFTPAAAWEDAKIGLRSMRLFDGCAIVSDTGWLRESVRLAGFLMPCPVRTFGVQDRDRAVEWLGSLPEGAGISHRLLPESGVIVAEVKEALRAQDFDALATTADTWIEAHGNLQGLVIHAREFPGWRISEASGDTCASFVTIIGRSRGSRWQRTPSSPAWRQSRRTLRPGRGEALPLRGAGECDRLGRRW